MAREQADGVDRLLDLEQPGVVLCAPEARLPLGLVVVGLEAPPKIKQRMSLYRALRGSGRL